MTAPSRSNDSPAAGTAPGASPRRRALRELAERIGHEFDDLGLLDQALCHASSSQDGKSSYERLEFLGDAVLGYLVADHLFRADPRASEGALTNRRAAMVNRGALAQVSRALGLSNLLQHGRGFRTAEFQSERIQADLVEAVLGAIACDGGVRESARFVRRFVLSPLEEPLPERPTKPTDPKSRLLHYTQSRGLGQPGYELVGSTGPDHERRFEVQVAIRRQAVATGKAGSKRLAEQRAAARALRMLEGDRVQLPPTDETTPSA